MPEDFTLLEDIRHGALARWVKCVFRHFGGGYGLKHSAHENNYLQTGSGHSLE